MTEKQRLLAVLRGEKADNVPWYGDLSYYYFSLEYQNLLPEKYKGEEGYLRLHQDLGIGVFVYPPMLWTTTYTNGVKHTVTEANNERVSIFETPVGRIQSTERFLPSNFSWAYSEHYVKNMDDFRVMLYVHQNARHEENYAAFERTAGMWGDSGVAAGMTPISAAPIQKLLARWAGVETTVELYMDEPDEFEDIMSALEESEDDIFDIIAQSPAQYVEFPENLSSEITGRNFFSAYNAPYYTRRNAQLHKHGKLTGIHIDGTLSVCLPMLSGCGFDVGEAVTPVPAGDVEPENLRACAGEGIAVWGGLPGGIFTPAMSDSEFERYVDRLIGIARADGRFILGVADQIPPDGIFERVAHVRRALGK